MKFSLEGHSLRTAAEDMLITLFPGDDTPTLCAPGEDYGEDRLHSSLKTSEKIILAQAELRMDGRVSRGVRRVRTDGPLSDKERKRLSAYAVKESIFRAALSELPEKPAWGSLTGVRPAKLASGLIVSEGGRKAADRVLGSRYHVDALQRRLSLDCAEESLQIASALEPEDIALFIAIPFCPTRCHYCSFVSHSIEKAKDLLPPYLAMLEKEIRFAASAAERAGRRITSIYIGGGTPTVLSAQQLEQLTGRIKKEFDLSAVAEYTVEAGRPDTIDEEKLYILRKNGVDRISVNPQSMNPRALAAAGRPHTPEDVVRACTLARKEGFRTLNMDVIAGLPEDTPEDFDRTIEALLEIRPENLTLHTLAYKRGADFRQSGMRFGDRKIGEMLKAAYKKLDRESYHPYYLYRQKYMASPCENTGWSLKGHESLYNVAMMEELCCILGLGAGAVTKMVDPDAGVVRRLFNPKFPYEYNRAEEKLSGHYQALDLFWKREGL